MGSVDLSDQFKEKDHSFSGTFAQKLDVTTVRFVSSTKIDFLPNEVLVEFPHLNGIRIHSCTLPTVKNELFTKNFNVLEYVQLDYSQIHTIEPEAFQHLIKLKWVNLYTNQIESLPFQIFKNNPELVYINLQYNKINEIDSNFFKNLNKLKFVGFTSNNLCVSKDFGCSSSTCSVSQVDLNSGLATCYSNCLKDMECSLKSGKFDKFSSDYIKENIDSIVAYGHLDVLIQKNFTDLLVKRGYLNLMVENGFLDSLVAQNYLDPLIQNGHLDLLIEKNYTDLLVEKGYKNQIIESDWRLKFNWNETNNSIKNLEEPIHEMIEKIKNDSLKSEANLLEKISKNSNEIKTIEKKFEEISTMFGSDLKVQQDKVGVLEKTVANLEENLKNCEGQVNLVDQSKRTVQEVAGRSSKMTENCEAKLLMENERLQFQLNEAKYIIDKQAMESEIKSLKLELMKLKLESERREAAWKNEMKALKDQFNNFEMSRRA
jgi:hypothetical protein